MSHYICSPLSLAIEIFMNPTSKKGHIVMAPEFLGDLRRDPGSSSNMNKKNTTVISY